MLNLTVIIPTLNEEAHIRATILHVLAMAHSPSLLEIMVIDAGSTDQTLAAIEDLPVSCYVDPTFRHKKYASLNFGLQKAKTQWIQFLDADTHVPHHFDFLIQKEMSKGAIGGAFVMRFFHADWRLFVLTRINEVRYRLWKTCYGDQAIFCDRTQALAAGGFPETLMEAAFFCKKLKKRGPFSIISERVYTSARRFEEVGFWKMLWFDLRMWLRFCFHLSLKNYTTAYWKQSSDHE